MSLKESSETAADFGVSANKKTPDIAAAHKHAIAENMTRDALGENGQAELTSDQKAAIESKIFGGPRGEL